MKYKTINGWTKKKMIERIMERNDGTMCYDVKEGVSNYRDTKTGNHCSAGCFLKGDPYEIEGLSLDEISKSMLSNLFNMPIRERGFFELQYLHDTYFVYEDTLKYAPGYMWTLLIDWIEDNLIDEV